MQIHATPRSALHFPVSVSSFKQSNTGFERTAFHDSFWSSILDMFVDIVATDFIFYMRFDFNILLIWDLNCIYININ